jgi:hypothetical protein
VVCDVGYRISIIYDSRKEIFIAKHNDKRIHCKSIAEVLHYCLGQHDYDIFDITTIRGIKLPSIAKLGDSYFCVGVCIIQ